MKRCQKGIFPCLFPKKEGGPPLPQKRDPFCQAGGVNTQSAGQIKRQGMLLLFGSIQGLTAGGIVCSGTLAAWFFKNPPEHLRGWLMRFDPLYRGQYPRQQCRAMRRVTFLRQGKAGR
jgi:hypothetical protein